MTLPVRCSLYFFLVGCAPWAIPSYLAPLSGLLLYLFSPTVFLCKWPHISDHTVLSTEKLPKWTDGIAVKEECAAQRTSGSKGRDHFIKLSLYFLTSLCEGQQAVNLRLLIFVNAFCLVLLLKRECMMLKNAFCFYSPKIAITGNFSMAVLNLCFNVWLGFVVTYLSIWFFSWEVGSHLCWCSSLTIWNSMFAYFPKLAPSKIFKDFYITQAISLWDCLFFIS